jgi:hypothetical protein
MEKGQCASVDSHVVCGYFQDDGNSHEEAIRLLKDEAGFTFKIPPSSLRDLYVLKNDGHPYADAAFQGLSGGFFEAPHLDESDLEIIEARVDCLEASGAFPKALRSHLRVLVEASYLQSDVLITSNPYLLDSTRATVAQLSCGFRPVAITHSRDYVAYFQKT